MGPYVVLIDKCDILANAVFPGENPGHNEQVDNTRRIISGFWHDVSHFVTARARNQLWLAYGQLELLRQICINLTRLHDDFTAEALGYEKVDQTISTDQLSPLKATYCPMERDAMLQAMKTIIEYYQQIARQLVQTPGIAYPDQLAEIMVGRFERVRLTS
jgi:hypothetical protein